MNNKEAQITPEYSKVIALTGSSGSGKSTVAGLLKELGASVISADSLSKLAVEKGSEGLSNLVGKFGPEILLEDGELDRKKFAEIIFNQPDKRTLAEEVIHPQVKALALKEFKKAIEAGSKVIIYDAPLYFEAGLDKLNFKAVITVHAPESICIERIMVRDSISLEEAQTRLKNQIPSEIKLNLSDHIILNNTSLQKLEENVRQVYNILLQSK